MFIKSELSLSNKLIKLTWNCNESISKTDDSVSHNKGDFNQYFELQESHCFDILFQIVGQKCSYYLAIKINQYLTKVCHQNDFENLCHHLLL